MTAGAELHIVIRLLTPPIRTALFLALVTVINMSSTGLSPRTTALLCLLLLHYVFLSSLLPSSAQLAAPTVSDPSSTTTSSSNSSSLSDTGVTIASTPIPPSTFSSARLNWVGTFLPVASQCLPSSTCCCSNGQAMTVSLDSSSSAGLDLAGDSDGGSGCFYQSTLGGLLSLTSAQTAFASFPALGLNITATLSADDNTLQIVSTRTSCAVDFTRSSSTPAPSSQSAAVSTGGGWAGFTDSSSAAGGLLSPTSSLSWQARIRPVTAVESSSSPPEQQHAYIIAFAVPRFTPISSVYFHYATTSNPATSSLHLALTSPSPVSFQSQQPLQVFSYSPLVLSDSDVVTYTFSFIFASQTQATPFATFSFNSTQSEAQLTADSSSSSTGSVPAPPASLLVGQYQTTTQCAPSASCCCGKGIVVISSPALASTSSALTVTGALDGGSGCSGETELSGLFSPRSSDPLLITQNFSADGITVDFDIQLLSSAPNALPPVSLSSLSSLSPLQYSALQREYSVLSITNSFQTCSTTATRILSASAVAVQPSPQQLPFIGSYQFDSSQCQPSESCCCAIGNLSVSASAVNSSVLMLSGTLDGGSACLGQSVISESFSIVSAVQASFSLPPVLLTATMQHVQGGGLDGSDGNNALSFVNNIYPMCVSHAERTSLLPATTAAASSSPPAAPPVASASLLGQYQSDGSCVPSSQCCCVDGTTTVAVSASSASVLLVSTNLDGELLSCFNQDGPVQLQMSLLNATEAVGQFASVAFTALWQPDGSVEVENSLHPACPSRLVKLSASNGVQGCRDRGSVVHTMTAVVAAAGSLLLLVLML